MATRLRNLRLNRVDLVDRGANPAAHITLFKRHEDISTAAPAKSTTTTTTTTANAGSVTMLAKALDAYPGLPAGEALERYFRANPEAYEHYRRQVGYGAAGTFTPKAAPAAPTVTTRADATARLMKLADLLRGNAGVLTRSESIALAAHVAGDLYAVHSGHPSMVRKAGPPAEATLERQITDWFRSTRDLLRAESDKRAAELTAAQMREAFAELLNIWTGA